MYSQDDDVIPIMGHGVSSRMIAFIVMGHGVEFTGHIAPLGYVDFTGCGLLLICHSVSFIGRVVWKKCS